ncbi:MAG: DUF2312 domain-containing protein [Defluviicoccus sp.]|nr:MAG: DUF2312 domain-containing protein [Defluviicoccus sp.]
MSIGYGTDAGQKLVAYSDRMERLLDDMDALKEDLKELKAEIKNDGFNVRALTKLVTIRRNRKTAEVETELLNDLLLYAHATGTPLDCVPPGEDTAEPASSSPSSPAVSQAPAPRDETMPPWRDDPAASE